MLNPRGRASDSLLHQGHKSDEGESTLRMPHPSFQISSSYPIVS